jgi:mycothiol synthase
VSLPAGYSQRPASWADVDAIVALTKACDLADSGVEDPVREILEEDWRQPGHDLERNTAVVEAPDGSMAAYVGVYGVNPERSLDVNARVHPAHRGRGIGGAVVDWAQARAAELVPPGATSMLYPAAVATDAAARRLFEDRGFREARVFWHMERELSAAPASVAPPDGCEIRPYDHGRDAGALYEVLEEAFEDHWGHEPYPREAHARDMARADHGLIWLAVCDGEPVGGLIARLVEGSGWIDDVGVRRPWRGRGLGRALLLTAFAALAGRGVSTVALNVDSDSPTSAPSLYDGVGMHVRRAWQLYERPVGRARGPDVS